ncbi:cytochrome C [Chitinophaga silvatica]|uniref:Cytochrome C n=1 Tax=Chitinophaga silvatica TaxID=2282649 RepID=A0A3E1YBT6_9BACT|nr:cbb3-type cytochrome c oxidase N-terminal domain-containing protein [Chitinophaga silvatica]RFS23451.1 cytochrome C [Chitinophaga silvatica]
MKKSYILLLLANLLLSPRLFALSQEAPTKTEEFDPVAIILMIVIVGLAIVIIVLGNAVLGAIEVYRERIKKEGQKLVAIAALAGLTLFSNQASAQGIFATLDSYSYYLLLSVLGVEILVIFSLIFTLKFLVGIKRKQKVKTATKKVGVTWLERLNRTKSLDAVSEEEADMGHNYDGIRELNNPTPPWWKWGFIFTIGFGIVYTWRTEISHTAPNQLEELAAAEEKAAIAKEEYLKKAANNIDENNVTLLTDAGELAAGQKLFVASCAPCHGAQGQGVVGPNLTDDYWLHGGKINDVFKTIKYGVAEKGMKAWQEDFSPKQLAQLASFVKSIHGSNPANPKEPQGQKE